MRSTLWLLGLGVALFACTSDTTRVVYMDLSYQVRCLDCRPAAPDESAHRIKAVEGEGGLALSCQVTQDGDTRRISFSSSFQGAGGNDKYVLRVDRADLDGSSNDPCLVHIEESGNTYEGACGSDDPSEDRPCKVELSVEDGVVKGSLHCASIENLGSATDIRYLVSPLTRDTAAPFMIYGCKSL